VVTLRLMACARRTSSLHLVYVEFNARQLVSVVITALNDAATAVVAKRPEQAHGGGGVLPTRFAVTPNLFHFKSIDAECRLSYEYQEPFGFCFCRGKLSCVMIRLLLETLCYERQIKRTYTHLSTRQCQHATTLNTAVSLSTFLLKRTYAPVRH